MTDTQGAGGRAGKSPAVASFLSFLWPGLGQWYGGRRRTALLYGIPVLVVFLILGIQLVGGLDALAVELITPTFALTLLILLTLLGLWRLLAMSDALTATGRRGGWRSGSTMGLFGVLVAVVLGSHLVLGYYAWSFYDSGSRIFVAYSPDGGPATDDASPGDVTGQFEATPQVTPATTSSRINVLLTGIDASLDRNHALTDTMIVVSIDPVAKKVALLSFPRDIAQFSLYNGGTYSGKLNSLMVYAGQHADRFPDGPLPTLMKEVGFLLGVPIHYYAAIDLDGFQAMVNAIGGVDVVNPQPISDPSYIWGNHDHPDGFYLQAGPVHLNGEQALAFVRSRMGAGDNDFTRANRQQLLLQALRHELTTPAMLPRLPGLLDAMGHAIRTSFPADQLNDLLALSRQINDSDVTRKVLGPPYAIHPPTNTTGGTYILRLQMDKLKELSVAIFGRDSAYYGQIGNTQASPGP